MMASALRTSVGSLGNTVTALAATAALIAGVAYVAQGTVLGDPCSVRVGEEDRELSHDAARTVTTVAGVGLQRGASTEVVAAVLTETVGAEKVLGLSPAQAAALYDAVPADLPPGDTALAEALLGHDGGALTCRANLGDTPDQAEQASGLTPRAERLREAMTATFGDLPLGGFAPGGVSTGHIDGSAHYDGRAIDVFFRPVTEENTRAGWVLSQWAVAHADVLGIRTVIFDDRIWTARRSIQGWREYGHPSGDDSNSVLRHLDHVHVDVA
jgi:hypothetical protein